MDDAWWDKGIHGWSAIEINADGNDVIIKKYDSDERIIFTIAEWKEIIEFVSLEISEK